MRKLFELHRDNVNFELSVDPNFLRRLWVNTAALSTEVSALGELEWNEEQTELRIPDELHMIKQTASGGGVHMDRASIGDMLLDRADKGLASHTLKVWWHSHVNMAVFWSGTDENNMATMLEDLGEPFVSVVTNHDGESRWRIYAQGREFNGFAKLGDLEPTAEEIDSARSLLKEYVHEEYRVPFWGGGRGRRKWGSGFRRERG